MKVYIVECYSDEYTAGIAVCSNIELAKKILKDKAEQLIQDGGDIDWDIDGLGFDNRPYGDRYAIIATDVLEG